MFCPLATFKFLLLQLSLFIKYVLNYYLSLLLVFFLLCSTLACHSIPCMGASYLFGRFKISINLSLLAISAFSANIKFLYTHTYIYIINLSASYNTAKKYKWFYIIMQILKKATVMSRLTGSYIYIYIYI